MLKSVDEKTGLFFSFPTIILLAFSIIFPQIVWSANFFSGMDSFFGTEDTMSSSFFRSGTPGNPCSPFIPGNFQYKQFKFTSDDTGQLTVNFDPQSCGTDIYVTFHTEPFVPASICDNYIWSFGTSTAFSETFNVPKSTDMTMVVSGIFNAPGVKCGPFNWNLVGAIAPVDSTITNLWVKSLRVKNKTEPSSDSWQANFIYNADRRKGHIFDPANEVFSVALGDSQKNIPAGGFNVSSSGKFSYKSPKNSLPIVSITGDPSKQIINVKFNFTDIGADPLLFPVFTTVKMGDERKTINVLFNSKGKFAPTSSYLNDTFVVARNKLNNLNSPKGSLKAKLNLASPDLFPNYVFDTCKKCNQPTVTLRIFEDSTLLLTKDLTQLLFATKKVTSSGQAVYTIKKLGKDLATENTLSSFSYSSAKGGMTLGLSKLTLTNPLTVGQAHLGIEIEIDGKTYATSVTMFANDILNNGYSSSYTKISSPL